MLFPKKNIHLLLFCCLFSVSLQAQSVFTALSISRLTPDDGLSQGSNYFRYEDSRGFMWLTGNDAINRYDGKTIKVYNLNKYFSNCPNLQQGYGFAEDTESNIYIGSVRGLYVYQRKQDKFTLQPIFKNNVDSVAMPFAFRDGKVWCFNRYYQVAVYDVQTKEVKLVAKPVLDSITSVHIYNLLGKVFYYRLPFFDEAGTLWIVGSNNIAAYNSATQQVSYPFDVYIKKRKPDFLCACCSNGKIICGTAGGVAIFDCSTKQVEEINKLGNKATGYVRLVSSNKKMVAFLCDAGIVFTKKNYKEAQWFDPGAPENYTKIFNFSFDKAGRLWMCDDGEGLHIFDFTPKLLGKEPSDAYPDRFKLGLGVGFFTELPGGNVLCRNTVEQVRDTRKLSYLPLSFEKELLVTGYRAYADDYRKGVWFFEERGNSMPGKRRLFFYSKAYEKKIIVATGIDEVHSTLKDMLVLADGSILCSFEEGLFWLYPETASMQKVKGAVQRQPFKINALSSSRIAVSYLNSDMLLYKILPDKSLQLLKPILPGIQSFYIQQDTIRNRYWAGTNAGVYLLDSLWNSIKHFDANNGLAGTYIYGLLLDDAGNAWCSHQRGLSSINGQHFQVINYNKNDGIQDWDFHNRSFLKSSDGTLFFGGAAGFNYFKPPLHTAVFYKPEVYVDEILVNGKPYLPGTNADYIDQLELEYSLNDVSVKALVKDLVNGNMQQLIYRIAETDTTWKLLPNGEAINFNQLAPGTYTLQLGAYDKYSAEKKVQKSIHIVVSAPFYRKAWFWALLAILATAVVFRYVNVKRMERQRIKFQEQLALEKQRQKITADLHDDIGASLSSLQINSTVAEQLLDTDRAAARAMLHKLQTQAHSLADKIGDFVWSMKPGKEEFMTLSSRIKNFAGEMLEAANIGCTLAIAPEIDSLVTGMELRKNLVFILKEAINNAAKYSRASTVAVSLQHSSGIIYLRVTDDGIGFEAGRTNGNGTGNMQRRAAELGGILSVQSAPGEGTVVAAEIPLVPKINDGG